MTIIPQMTLIKAMVGMRLPSEKYGRRERRPPSSKYFEGDKTAEEAGDERSETTGVALGNQAGRDKAETAAERSARSSHNMRAGQCPLDLAMWRLPKRGGRVESGRQGDGDSAHGGRWERLCRDDREHLRKRHSY